MHRDGFERTATEILTAKPAGGYQRVKRQSVGSPFAYGMTP
jgi:hypothetical protein